jgi:hypothetical protein
MHALALLLVCSIGLTHSACKISVLISLASNSTCRQLEQQNPDLKTPQLLFQARRAQYSSAQQLAQHCNQDQRQTATLTNTADLQGSKYIQ